MSRTPKQCEELNKKLYELYPDIGVDAEIGSDTVRLDGHFSVEQLETLVQFMKEVH